MQLHADLPLVSGLAVWLGSLGASAALNPKGVRAGWVVGSEGRWVADLRFLDALTFDAPQTFDTPPPLPFYGGVAQPMTSRLCPTVHPKVNVCALSRQRSAHTGPD